MPAKTLPPEVRGVSTGHPSENMAGLVSGFHVSGFHVDRTHRLE